MYSLYCLAYCIHGSPFGNRSYSSSSERSSDRGATQEQWQRRTGQERESERRKGGQPGGGRKFPREEGPNDCRSRRRQLTQPKPRDQRGRRAKRGKQRHRTPWRLTCARSCEPTPIFPRAVLCARSALWRQPHHSPPRPSKYCPSPTSPLDDHAWSRPRSHLFVPLQRRLIATQDER